MILITVFDQENFPEDCGSALKVPDRLDYNLPKLWDDFDEWIEDNQKYIQTVHQGEFLIRINCKDFIYWLNHCVLEKDEHIRVLDENVDMKYINNKYPKRKRHILYFENTFNGHLEYMGGLHRAKWH